jgi:hypothetical protein
LVRRAPILALDLAEPGERPPLNLLRSVAALGVLASLGGCHLLMPTVIEYVPLDPAPHPLSAKASGNDVELFFDGKMPERNYVFVGSLQAEVQFHSRDSAGEMLEDVRERAAAIGCDALLLTGVRTVAPGRHEERLSAYRAWCVVYVDVPAGATASALGRSGTL